MIDRLLSWLENLNPRVRAQKRAISVNLSLFIRELERGDHDLSKITTGSLDASKMQAHPAHANPRHPWHHLWTVRFDADGNLEPEYRVELWDARIRNLSSSEWQRLPETSEAARAMGSC